MNTDADTIGLDMFQHVIHENSKTRSVFNYPFYSPDLKPVVSSLCQKTLENKKRSVAAKYHNFMRKNQSTKRTFSWKNNLSTKYDYIITSLILLQKKYECTNVTRLTAGYCGTSLKYCACPASKDKSIRP